jgi:uncharacterized OB-fold protein
MTVYEASAPPQPEIDADSVAFWDGVNGGHLQVCRCRHCRHWLQPPLERCRSCEGPTRFERVAGLGTLHSFIVVHYAAFPALADILPYIVGLVELDEQYGLRIPGRLAVEQPSTPEIGMRVSATVETYLNSVGVLVFRPIDITSPDGREPL